MIHHFMTFEAIVQHMKENFQVVNTSNADDSVDGFDRSFKCEIKEYEIKLIWAKNYISSIKPENEIETTTELYLHGDKILTYTTDSYTTTFNSDDHKMYLIYEALGKPKLKIDYT